MRVVRTVRCRLIAVVLFFEIIAFAPALQAGGAGPVACGVAGCGSRLPCPVHNSSGRSQRPQRNRQDQQWVGGGTAVSRTRTPPGPNLRHLGGGRYLPKAGYRWVWPNNGNNFSVERIPVGTPHPTIRNVVWGPNGTLRPAFGYRFISGMGPGRPRVERIPVGAPHGRYPLVVWSGNRWKPAPGFRWKNPGLGADFSVVRIPIVIHVRPPGSSVMETYMKRIRRIRQHKEAHADGFRLELDGELEKAKAAYERAIALTKKKGPELSGYQQDLARLKRKLRERKAQAQAGDSLVRVIVPSPARVEKHFIRLDRAWEDWAQRGKPLVEVTAVVLEGARRGMGLALRKQIDETKLLVDRQMKNMPGYCTFKRLQGWHENWEMLNTGIAKRREKLAARNFSVVRTVVESHGTHGDEMLLEKEAHAEIEAAVRLAKKAAKLPDESKPVNEAAFRVGRWLGK